MGCSTPAKEYRGDPILFASQIAGAVGSRTSALTWNELTTVLPEIQFILPQDFLQLQKELTTRHGIMVTKDNGVPRQIGKGI